MVQDKTRQDRGQEITTVAKERDKQKGGKDKSRSILGAETIEKGAINLLDGFVVGVKRVRKTEIIPSRFEVANDPKALSSFKKKGGVFGIIFDLLGQAFDLCLDDVLRVLGKTLRVDVLDGAEDRDLALLGGGGGGAETSDRFYHLFELLFGEEIGGANVIKKVITQRIMALPIKVIVIIVEIVIIVLVVVLLVVIVTLSSVVVLSVFIGVAAVVVVLVVAVGAGGIVGEGLKVIAIGVKELDAQRRAGRRGFLFGATRRSVGVTALIARRC